MRRRRLLLGAGALALLGLAGLWLAQSLRPGPEPGVTMESFRRLRLGMNEQEVEAIPGQPGDLFGGGYGRYWDNKEVAILYLLRRKFQSHVPLARGERHS